MARQARSFLLCRIAVASYLAAAAASQASSLLISAGSDQRAPTQVEADYTTPHLFLNEVAQDSVPIPVFFDPQVNGVPTAEVFSNLNRRDYVTATPNAN